MSLAPLPGEWSVVEGHGEGHLRTAAAIEQAIAHLQTIRDDDATIARSIDRVREAAGEVSEQLGRATSRFAVTGEALVDYAERLRLAQHDAGEAIERWDAADAAHGDALADLARLRGAADGDAGAAVDLAEQRAAAAAAEREEAGAAWRAARARKEEAALDAEARIRAETDGSTLEDSRWDDVRGALLGFLSAVADATLEAIRALGAVVLASVAVLVAAALAIALMATGLVGMLLGGLALLLVASWVLAGGADAFVRTLVATGSVEAALLAATIGWLRGTMPELAAWLVEGDAGRPALCWSGEQEPVAALGGTPGERLARLQAGNRAADARAGAPAELLAAPSTMIAVTAVTGADGRTAYRVAVPSTQVWTPGSSALNDVHAGVAAKLGAGATQLELAVVAAMDEAGVPPGASVLLTGWSLGGIAAAALAADPAFTARYDVDAVVVAGASIDDEALRGHIPVLAFEHARGARGIGDPVPHTEDPAAERHDGAHRTVVRVAPPAGAGLVPHSGLAYQRTMQEQGDLPGSTAHTWMALHDLDRYFVGVERTRATLFERGR